MLDYYHYGAYGQVHQQKWSCCGAANRDSQGCQRTSTLYNGSKQLRRTASLRTESRSPSKGSRRQFSSTYRKSTSNQRDHPVNHDAKQDSSLYTQSMIATTASSHERKPPPLSLIHQDSQEDTFE